MPLMRGFSLGVINRPSTADAHDAGVGGVVWQGPRLLMLMMLAWRVPDAGKDKLLGFGLQRRDAHDARGRGKNLRC